MSKALDVQKAVHKILSRNFRPILLGLTISPTDVMWEYAVQFKDDSKFNWHPKVIRFHRKDNAVSIRNGHNDFNATYVGAETILTIAENNLTAPKPPNKAV